MTMKKTILYLMSILFLAGCELAEVNENPNVPDDVPLETLLPPAQFDLAEAIGGRAFRYTNIFSQHLEGTNNQELNTENYSPDELFVGYLWDDFYAGSMIKLRFLIDKAEAQNAPHYAGVGKILMATALGTVTDIWGAVPFSDALSADNVQPEYDSQPEVYAQIIGLLDEAMEDLQAPESVFSPGNDDVVYQGNLAAWMKAASALKARYLLHQVNVNPALTGDALNAAQGGFSSSFEDYQYSYLGTDVDGNPIFQYYEITPNAVIDAQFIGIMGIQDPRFEFFIDIIPFTGGESKVGEALASPDSPVKFISYVEQKFIEAECLLRDGQTPQAEEALQEAIRTSVEDNTFGTLTVEEVDEFVADFVLTGDLESDLELLIEQKYIALFTTPEPWVDFRRTGYPQLDPNEGAVSASNPNGEIPLRLMYPQNERLLNPNVPTPLPNMQTPLWWQNQ